MDLHKSKLPAISQGTMKMMLYYFRNYIISLTRPLGHWGGILQISNFLVTYRGHFIIISILHSMKKFKNLIMLEITLSLC